MPAYPTGATCKGSDADRRGCIEAQKTNWALSMLGLYEREVAKRQIEHRCRDKVDAIP